MKRFIIVSLIFAVALSHRELLNFQLDKTNLQYFKVAVVNHFQGALLEYVPNKDDYLRSADSSANLNDFVDSILPKINQAISDAGYDPTPLPDEKINIGIGTSHLTEGNLTELATMERYRNVTLTYDKENNLVAIEFILRWDDLKMVYKYHTKVLFISSTGHVHGHIKHMKIHLKLGFNLNEDHIEVDRLDFKHTGDITLTFTGNGLLDYIEEAMSGIFIPIFHNLILDIVKKVAMDPVQDIIDALNEVIDDALHPSSSTSSIYSTNSNFII